MTSIAANVTLDTTGATASINQFANATDAQLKRIARAYEATAREQRRANQLQAEANKLAREAAGADEVPKKAARAAAEHGKAVADATEKVHVFNLASAGTTRELLVLTHELSQGNYKRFGGSMIVLAEQMRLGTVIFSATGVALLGVGAAAAFAASSLVHGAEQQAEYNKNVLLTGNYAGLTAGKLDEMTAALARSAHVTQSSAREALMAAQGTGAFGPASIAAAGEAVQRLAHVTGEETAKIAGDFASMQNGVAKWAEEHNRQMHFMSAAQYVAVRSMEEAGRTEEAQKLVLDTLNERLREGDKNLGAFARAWQNVKNAVDGARDAIAQVGRGDNTDTMLKSAQMQAQLLHARLAASQQPGGVKLSAPLAKQLEEDAKAADAWVAKLQESKKLADDVAKATADADRRQAAGITGADTLKRLGQEVDRRTELQRKMDEYHKSVQQMKDAGLPAPSEAEQAAWEALARAKWQNPGDRKMATEAQSLAKSLADETAKVQEQTAQILKYGKALDNAHEAEVRFRLGAHGDLKVSPAEGSRLIGLAQQEDMAEAAKRQAEHEAQVRKSVEAYKELTTARELSARDAYIQQQVETRVGATITQTTQALKDYAAEVAKDAGRNYDQTQADKFAKDAAARQLAFNKEVDAINRQNEGLFQSALAREKAADAAKLQASAAEEVIKYPEREAEILARLTKNLEQAATAREQAYAQSRSPAAGVATAANKLYEDATNGAKVAENLVNTAFDGMTQALDRFAKTGKLSFRSLWQSMASEYLAAVERMAVAKLLGSTSGGGLLGLLGLAGGGAGAAASGAAVTDAGVTAMVGFAAEGGHISTGSPFIVGEKGPELFVPTGSGDVVPNDQLSSGRGGMVFHVGQGQVINVGQGVSRAEVASAVSEANARTLAQVQRLSRTGRLVRG